MLTKRIIPCLDVKDGMVVKGVQFRNHEVIGGVLDLARRYCDEGADELVFYDISASTDSQSKSLNWVPEVARFLDIPFCVAGGIRDIEKAKFILNSGADKISINSPALENPKLISELSNVFGSQCVVVGIDSFERDGQYYVYQYTGDLNKMRSAAKNTIEWAQEAESLGAGEVVLNCMNQDGVRNGYDIQQLQLVSEKLNIPVVASGGAGSVEHFKRVFQETDVSGALASSVFHKKIIFIPELKKYLKSEKIEVRLS